jgi:hypothetical protein
MARRRGAAHAATMLRHPVLIRTLIRSATLVLACAVVGLTPSAAHAQTGDVTAYCAASIASNVAESKSEILAAIDAMLAVAPADVVQPGRQLRDILATKGKRAVETPEGFALVNQIDAYTYDHCPGAAVPVTAVDYEYQGIPATMRAGLTRFKVTNTSSTEDHEMIFIKLTPAGERMDPARLLALPAKKQDKLVDFSHAEFIMTAAGQTGYAYADLAPGKYLYVCPLPVGGKEKGKPHFVEGMYGTTTVS